ncbi:MAG: glucose-1-phosphate adenylyltransferase, partial [Clostridia bacterium]|nr:glucose-1-phosphate adenylyltransferase [Clostridia bacterium]
DSLWEANMDLLDPKTQLDLSDPSWRIYARNTGLPPHYLSERAHVQNSIISEGGNIGGVVDFSVIFSGVTIDEGAQIRDSIIMPGVHVKKGAVVQYAIVAEDALIEENAVVGGRPEDTPTDQWGVAVVAAGRTVGKGCRVAPKAMVEADIGEEEN